MRKLLAISPRAFDLSLAKRALVLTTSPNSLLASIPESDFVLLRPFLQIVELVREKVLVKAGQPLTRVYFPYSGVISLVVSLDDGKAVEVAMVGHDSVFGSSIALDGRIALNDAIVQLPGFAASLDADRFQTAVEESSAFRTILIRHELALFAQAQQSAACNAFHTTEARLSKWLLRMRDLTGGDILPLTQEFLSQMIGVQRNGVSIVANLLQREGIIRYSRGLIEISDVEGLKDKSCECYEAVKRQYDRLLVLNHPI